MEKDKKYFFKEKLSEEKKQYKRKCKHCGWDNEVINRYNKTICKNCGNYVFIDDKEEFIYRMREKLNEKN